MSIYETVLFIFVGFIVVFCVFITMSLQMTNKELERTQKTVEKQGMLWVYMPFETRFEVGYFLANDTWIKVHVVPTEEKAMMLVNYLNGGNNGTGKM